MDELEDFIMKNKNDFESPVLDKEKMWRGVQEKMNQQNTSKAPEWLRVVKWVFTFLLVGLLIILYARSSEEGPLPMAEINKIENYYSQTVSYEMDALMRYQDYSEADKHELLEYFGESERQLEELKKDFDQNLNNDDVIAAIIGNYRQRLAVIENLLKHTQHTNTDNNEKAISL